MEINNCEQYVLAELDYEQRRNERLVAENNKLAKQLDAMTKRAKSYKETIDRPKTPIEALPDDISEETLIRFMRDDLKAIYDEQVAKCTE